MTIDSTSETRTESRKGVTAMNNGRTVEALSVSRGARRRASMSTRALLAAVCLAVVVPACGPNPDEQIAMTSPVEDHRGPADRLYVANETAGSITVIDTTTNSVIATVGLGSDPAIPGTPQPNGPNNAPTAHHSPFYDGHADPHGLWLTDDDRFLLVAARLSGTLVAIDTTTLRVVGYLPVGREPHLATVRPGADEAWVAVRGENYVEIVEVEARRLLDGRRLATDRLESTAKLHTANGPSMVSFTSDGSAAFVAMGKEARVQRFDAPSRTLTHEVPASAPFTPFGLVSPDDTQLWLVHKGAGSVSVLRTADLGTIVAGMAVGPRANHVAFAANLAYVTVGGPAPSAENPDPEGKVVVIDRSTRAVVAELTGPPWRGEPHGIWASGDKLYVGHERGNRLTVVDLGDPAVASDDTVGPTVDGLGKPIDLVASSR